MFVDPVAIVVDQTFPLDGAKKHRNMVTGTINGQDKDQIKRF